MIELQVTNQIQKIVHERGIKAKWLAAQVGVSGPALSGYLKNVRQPDATVLARIAKVLDLTVDDLLTY